MNIAKHMNVFYNYINYKSMSVKLVNQQLQQTIDFSTYSYTRKTGSGICYHQSSFHSPSQRKYTNIPL